MNIYNPGISALNEVRQEAIEKGIYPEYLAAMYEKNCQGFSPTITERKGLIQQLVAKKGLADKN